MRNSNYKKKVCESITYEDQIQYFSAITRIKSPKISHLVIHKRKDMIPQHLGEIKILKIFVQILFSLQM